MPNTDRSGTYNPKAPQNGVFVPSDFFGIPPEYFSIPPDAINPSMIKGREAWLINPEPILGGVKATWVAGREAIVSRKHNFHEGRPCPKHPDHMFAMDHSVPFVTDAGKKVAIVAQMKYPQRMYEVIEASEMLTKAGYELVWSDLCMEGGDVRFDRRYGYWIVGIRDRTEAGAGKILSEESGRPVLEVPTIDLIYYH